LHQINYQIRLQQKQFLLTEQERPLATYERLHDRITAKVADILINKLEDGDEKGCERRVATLKTFWTKRLNAYKKDLRVILAELDRHSARLFKLVDTLTNKPDKSADAILKELVSHKKKALKAVEANLIEA